MREKIREREREERDLPYMLICVCSFIRSFVHSYVVIITAKLD